MHHSNQSTIAELWKDIVEMDLDMALTFLVLFVAMFVAFRYIKRRK
jgi:hypothetical protein